MAKKIANTLFKSLEDVHTDFPTLMGGIVDTVHGS